MKIKVCGLTDSRSIHDAAKAGVDCVGFVFADSSRRLEPSEAARMAEDLPPEIERVAVLRLAGLDDVMSVLSRFPADRVQTEPARGILGAIGKRFLPVLHDGPDLERDAAALPEDLPVVLEAAGRGGRGVRPDWERARRLASRRSVFLAGGLHPGNVGEAIRMVRPWGLDVSSGIESSPGVKSSELIAEFVEAVRATESELVS